MKISQFLIILGVLLIIFGLYINTDKVYLANSINTLESTKATKTAKDVQNIGNIAYNVDNVINNDDISGVAKNIVRVEVYDGMTLNELSAKLNRSLKGVLANKGNLIATRCLKYGVDPYVAVAIMLHETGCSYRCSSLSTKYYNFGGMKGGKGYMHFASIDAGINKFIDNLYYGYYKKGLNTPEKMNKKYAESTSWSIKINEYVNKIKNK